MKTKSAYLQALALLLGPATNAFAAGSRTDNSGIFVWVFLGFCAIIVVAQLIPAIMVLLGIAKGVASPKEEVHEKAIK
ncbi:hypothetical protein [Geomesophilobacter sediminis]|uniref:Uncharacterized protein n=1 Tax=Geomesophilobacter sediminis TaxID=2798584 RepID=A0A8J7ISK7_9BACT|nr:hypothetical protein [Geomesophilobacter sediminis]MBJ6726304.1 hypothetical protein [Geomesophilobacter sediminis]